MPVTRRTLLRASAAADPTADLHVAVAANYLDAPPFDDEVLSGWAVHNNVDGFIKVPAVLSFGLARFAVARKIALDGDEEDLGQITQRGRAPRWDYEHDFAIAPHQIWDDAPEPG